MDTTEKKPVILIVEDDAIIALDLKNMLHHFSFGVAGPVARGELVEPYLAQHPADLVLMDILLEGDMDGIEAASIAMKRFDIPVVFATAQSDDMTIKRASEVSPYGLIVKPYNDREIYGTIRSVLTRHSLEKTVRESELSERRLNRALRVTSGAGRAILHCDTEDAYLDRICRAIVEEGDLAGAWIGYGKAGVNGGIVPVAKNGAARPGECADPSSVITLDISIDLRTRGVIGICAGAEPFGENERQLYEGFRSDVEHGIRYFRFKAEKDRAEAEIRYLHGFYKNVLEGLTDPILVTSADGNVAYVNAAMAGMVAHGSELVMGGNITGMPAPIKDALNPLYEKAKLTLKKTVFSGVDVSLGERTRIVAGAFIPRIRDSRYDGMICTFREQSSREKETLWRERYTLLSEYGRDVIMFIRPEDAVILETNRAVEELYGWTPDEMRGMSLYDIRAAETHSRLPSELGRANTDGIMMETLHRRRDGEVFPVEVNARGGELGGERVVISIIRDIRLRRRFIRSMILSCEERDLSAGLDLKNSLASALDRLSSDVHSATAEDISRGIRSAADIARLLSLRMAPVEEGPGGIVSAFESLRRAAERGGMRFSVEGAESVPSDLRQSTHLYLAAQDAVQEIIRRGGSSFTDIRIGRSGSRVDLSVIFDAPLLGSTENGERVLKVMNGRAELYGGFVVESADDQGRAVISCFMLDGARP